MRGKMILIEGTDCSGKETQSKLLVEYLKAQGIETVRVAFPDYDSPTGKIVGGPYLGKDYICNGWFPEGAGNVNPKVSALYYAADRLYHLDYMNKILDSGKWIILDRYVYSNLAHQGGKELNKKKRFEMYDWLSRLELDFIGLPDPEIKIFLHMPYECSVKLKQGREEKPDQHEQSEEHLRHAEKAYLEIAKLYNFEKIKCGNKDRIKSIEEINKEVIKVLKKHL